MSLVRGALYRAKAAYSHRPSNHLLVCVSVCLFVCLSVCPLHCGKTASRIWMRFEMVSGMGPGMRQVVGLRIGPQKGVI